MGEKTNRRAGPVRWTFGTRLEMRITFKRAAAPVYGKASPVERNPLRWTRWRRMDQPAEMAMGKSKRPPTFPGARRAGQGWQRFQWDWRDGAANLAAQQRRWMSADEVVTTTTRMGDRRDPRREMRDK